MTNALENQSSTRNPPLSTLADEHGKMQKSPPVKTSRNTVKPKKNITQHPNQRNPKAGKLEENWAFENPSNR